MEMEPFENPWIKKIRVLTHMLLLSVAANTGFITAFIYMKVHKNKGVEEYVEAKKGEKEETIATLVNTYFAFSFDQLAEALKDTVLVQDGLKRRDLALACLANFHYFNVEKGVSGKQLERRRLSFVHLDGKETFYLEVFSGLDDLDFQRIQNYLAEEKWPLTSEGLFIELKKRRMDAPDSLLSAFFATGDFCAINTLFGRVYKNADREKLLFLLLDANWDDVKELSLGAKKEGETPFEPVRTFLQSLSKKGSIEATNIWVELDREYLERKLDDKDLLQVIQLIREKRLSNSLFLKQLIGSVRADQIRKEAALKLFSLENITPPDPYEHETALKILFPTLIPEKPIPEKRAAPPLKKYKVTEGDSLWKVAKKHKIEVEALRDANHLKTDQLKPGQELVIP